MHTVWKGAISFGLVHVPVKMFSATEDKDISLRYIHKECGSPLSYVRKCPVCDKEVAWEEIGKGYEYEKGKFVLFDKEELDQLTEESSKSISILDFVDLTEIDPIYFQKTYYLAPDQAGANAYRLLMEAMRQTGKIGIAKISIRSKSSLAAIRVLENCLAIETIYYPDEVRPASQVPNLPEAGVVNDKELEMAKMLISQLSTTFDAAKYTDDYRQRMLDLIAHKVAGEEFHIAPTRQENNVIDLMAALQASIEAVQHIPSEPGPSISGNTNTKPQIATSKKKSAKAKGAVIAAPSDAKHTAPSVAKPVVEPAAEAKLNNATGPIPVIAPKPKRRSAKSKETVS